VDQTKCIGCGMCEARCPKKAITMVPAPGAAAGKHAEKEMTAV
jgi:formate hydrogenlyase subunit 6/NADH:ubiquinone oxidoreductase subunit I